MQVNPVYYDYNGKAGFSITKDNVGIIAQEMQEVLPNTIKTFTAKLNEGDENETELLLVRLLPLPEASTVSSR